MEFKQIRRMFFGVAVALIGLTVVFSAANAQGNAPVDPGVAEFGADAFVRILLENCPNCATDDSEMTGGGEVVLSVEFVGGTDEQRDEVERIAAQWEEATSIDFQFGTSGAADIRIVFEAERMGMGGLADSSVTALVDTGDSSRLNIRSGPGSRYPIIGKAYSGTNYVVIGRNAAGDWLELSAPNIPDQRGWVSVDYVDLSGDLLDLPVIVTGTGSSSESAGAGSSSAGVSPAVLGGWIVLPVWDAGSGTYSIYAVGADGSNLRKLVENASSPALSPDGTQLAYRDWARDNRGLVVANADGSAATRLTSFLEDILPSWSADGQRIIFSSYRESDRKSRIYYMWADRDKDWVLKRGQESVYGEDPYWMNSGRVAYTLHTRLPEDQLLTMNDDGSKPTVLLNDPTVRSPAGSPDGRFITLMSMRSGNWDIYRTNVDGSGLVQLTDHTANDGLPTWSPDGQSIAFVSDRGKNRGNDGVDGWGLWVMDADGRNQRLLATLPGPVDGIVRDELDYVTNGWFEEQISWSR